jgi:hypothetical protein
VAPKPKPLTKATEAWLHQQAASRKEVIRVSRYDVLRILGALAHDTQRLDRLYVAGQRLSNAAFNLSQREGKPLDANDVRSLAEGFRAWDEAVRVQQPAVRKRATTRRSK